MSRNALGRGLSALIREPEPPAPPQLQPEAQLPPPAPVQAQVPSGLGAATAAAPARIPNEGLLQVDIDLIDPSPYQPRTHFREQALEELAQSIRASGIIQPLVVRRVDGRYQLIAGERRWRAAQRAPLGRVPVVLRDVPEETALEMALVENLQREDLNPIEQARAFERLIEEFSFTQEEVAERTGKDRATIANSLRLLKLEETIQDMLEEGRLSAGHARALLSINDSKERYDLARRIARGGMTVRQVERLAARSSRTSSTHTPTHVTVVDPNTKAAIEEMQRKFGTKVLLQPLRPGRPGQLIFEYYDPSDLTRLYDQLMRQ
jgi:ParB family transcriptional regulator, chromosome partitioning protein